MQEKFGPMQALVGVAAVLLIFAGGITWLAARSHVNRHTSNWWPYSDQGMPPFRWPWLLSYVFLLIGFLLLALLTTLG